MGCFYFLRARYNINRKRRKPTTDPTISISPIASSKSNNGTTNYTSQSDESTTPKPVSKSSVSFASSQRSIPELYEERAHNLREFELQELRIATNDFNRLLKIGEGGFGSVYKGLIKRKDGKGENLVVAVKKLNPNSLQGHKQWLAEVQFLGVVSHPNLVKLIGYCSVDADSGPHRLLVYEFIPNKTLDDHLFNKAYPCLPWNIRLRIALGAAEGLLYLHEGLEVQVIYRDFKASNVLLDAEFRPKLSDFGLAREGPTGNQTHVSTAVMGTYGYAAPDYVETGHLTIKSDVWSFGVVLYEILTGRRSMERNRPKNQQKLLDWVKKFPPDSAQFAYIIDSRLENQYSTKAAREIARLANRCLSKYARDRPNISEVIERLREAMGYEELDGEVIERENFHPCVESENGSEKEREVESLRRRMVHLAKLRENTNAIAKRRFVIMKVGGRN